LNGDGKLDLAVLRPDGITVLLGNGHGEFHSVRGGDGIACTLAVAVGDFNNDGKPDLAVDDGSRVTVLLMFTVALVIRAQKISTSRKPTSPDCL